MKSSAHVRTQSHHPKGKENIIDASLEYHDPTPNIHDLFVKFSDKFFWGALGMVEVKWSSRMTSCAGVCSYDTRRGFCSIRLSAPLLSLRPRKNLIETLLHEMIHAYLFVTHNKKDREDHGPEFHKHMYRINKEAGTNITVYHDFVDEVAFYQKHIWRCNGPCQKRRPYFGFVRRAMNRAPGPNDLWWNEHKLNCGGTFIKVSEPEKQTGKKGNDKDKIPKNKKSNPNKGKDIRDFFPTSSPKILSENKQKDSFKSTNIHSFKDLISSSDKSCGKDSLTTYNVGNIWGFKSEKSNGVLDKPVKNTNITKVSDNENVKSSEVLLTVRNVWANKYPTTSNAVKKPSNDSLSEKEVDVKKRQVSCPICNKPVSETLINEHVDECLSDDCVEIVHEKINNLDNEIKPQTSSTSTECVKTELTSCPVCSETLEKEKLNDHLEMCLEHMFKDEDFVSEVDDDEKNVPCPCCTKWVPEKCINDHIDECLTIIALKNSE